MHAPRIIKSVTQKYAAAPPAMTPSPTAALAKPPALKPMVTGGAAPAAAKPIVPPRPAAPSPAMAQMQGRQNLAMNQMGTQPTTAPVVRPAAPMPAGRPQVDQAMFAQMRARQSQDVVIKGKPEGWDGPLNSYGRVLDRWYNPNTEQQVTEKGEEGLMRMGQTALGVGAGAGLAAGAVAAPAAAMTAANVASTGAALTGMGASSPKQPQQPQQPQQPTQPQQTTQPQQAQQTAATQKPPAPATPQQKQQANEALTTKLNDPNLPDADKKQAAQQHVQQMLDSNPEMKQGMADLHAGKDTPQSKAFQAEVDKAGNAYVREEFARLRQQNPNATPQQQGGMLNSIMQSYQQMPEPMKWMMGLGLGGGLLGVLGSMFGGGGGMGMLGLLGLGAAGLAGAGGGMFGQGAQNMMADAMTGIGKFTGMVPEKLTDEQKKILLSKDPVAAAAGGGGGWRVPSRQEAASQAAAGRQQLGQIKMLNSMGGMTPRMLEGMGLTPEEAQLAARNVGTLSNASADPNSAINQRIQQGENYAKPTWANAAFEAVTSPTRWFGGKTSSANLDRAVLKWAEMKTARCWKGYEPVPGKAPYSENSCRPIGSKKKSKKKTEKKAEDVVNDWLKKYRARGQKGRWVNTQRSQKAERKISQN